MESWRWRAKVDIKIEKKMIFCIVRLTYGLFHFSLLCWTLIRWGTTACSPERRRRELIENGRIAFLVVSLVVALAEEVEFVQVDGVPAEDAREELVPGDVLLDGGDDSAGLLEIKLYVCTCGY